FHPPVDAGAAQPMADVVAEHAFEVTAITALEGQFAVLDQDAVDGCRHGRVLACSFGAVAGAVFNRVADDGANVGRPAAVRHGRLEGTACWRRHTASRLIASRAVSAQPGCRTAAGG